jgi:RNA polymerase sigma-70 factor (ECF subfamily)
MEYMDERYDILRASMDKLKEDQRRCLEGFYLQGKSYQEISKDFNLGYKEVKSFIQNGKRNLKNLMLAAS